MREYILLAYKANNVDSCKSCVMERYDSDFRFIKTFNKEELINFYIEIEDIKIDSYENDYEIELLIADGTDSDKSDEQREIKLEVENRKQERLRLAQIETERKQKLLKIAQIKRNRQNQIVKNLHAEEEKRKKEQEEKELFLKLKQKYDGM